MVLPGFIVPDSYGFIGWTCGNQRFPDANIQPQHLAIVERLGQCLKVNLVSITLQQIRFHLVSCFTPLFFRIVHFKAWYEISKKNMIYQRKTLPVYATDKRIQNWIKTYPSQISTWECDIIKLTEICAGNQCLLGRTDSQTGYDLFLGTSWVSTVTVWRNL